MYGKRKNSPLNLFATDSKDACATAIKNGGIAAMVSAAITSVFAVIGMFTSSSDKNLNYLLDPWMLVDVVLIIILGIFIFRKSRVAATIMFLYFIAGRALMWYETGAPNGIVMALLFLCFYFTAMKATYLWHSNYKNDSNMLQ
jgi:hypothetical protein